MPRLARLLRRRLPRVRLLGRMRRLSRSRLLWARRVLRGIRILIRAGMLVETLLSLNSRRLGGACLLRPGPGGRRIELVRSACRGHGGRAGNS